MKRITTLLSSIFLTAAAVAQTYSPVAVTGYNVDGIAEDTMAITHSSQALDGSDYVLYTRNYGTRYSSSYGLPDNGTITSGIHTFQMEPYSQHNTLFIPQSGTDSLLLSTPASFASLSILGTSTEGTGSNTYTVWFTDGTSTTFSNITMNDWFNGGSSIISGIDRAGRTTGSVGHSSINPSLYANDLTLTCADRAKLVHSIVVANVGTHPRTCIFAVSGASAPSFTITNTNPACHGGQGRAVITPTGGSIPYSYTWSTSPIQNSDTAIGLIAGYYTVIANDASNCPVTLYDTITEPAGTNLTLTASADSLCPGAAITLTTTGAASYTWSAGTATDSSIIVHPLVSTVYSVTGTNGGGCTGAGTVTVHVRLAPAVGITFAPSRFICAGSSITLTGTGASSYQWSGGITNGTAFSPTAATTTYTVTGTDIHNCRNMDSLNVYVNPLPTITINVSPSDTVCAGRNMSLSGIGATSYQWSGGVTNGLVFAAPTSTTTYRVTGTDSHSCTNTDSITVHVKNCTGIEETKGELGMSIYPNPNNGTFSITANSDVKDINLVVSDLQGRVIYTANYTTMASGESKSINLNHAAAGLYLLHMQSGSQQHTEKIVIEK